ncbi:MAG: 30S ribosomal protein THX [Bacteroidales bacterium]|jgi:ribosomal small subunit protein bTHX|nr:30S ribosomal protein THX [Bacteroidales bacterium]
MGKGDKKSKRGKITIGSFGVRRLRKKTGKKAVVYMGNDKTIIATVPQAAEVVTKPGVVKEKAVIKAIKEKKEAKTGKAVKPEKQTKTPKAKPEKNAE